MRKIIGEIRSRRIPQKHTGVLHIERFLLQPKVLFPKKGQNHVSVIPPCTHNPRKTNNSPYYQLGCHVLASWPISQHLCTMRSSSPCPNTAVRLDCFNTCEKVTWFGCLALSLRGNTDTQKKKKKEMDREKEKGTNTIQLKHKQNDRTAGLTLEGKEMKCLLYCPQVRWYYKKAFWFLKIIPFAKYKKNWSCELSEKHTFYKYNFTIGLDELCQVTQYVYFVPTFSLTRHFEKDLSNKAQKTYYSNLILSFNYGWKFLAFCILH